MKTLIAIFFFAATLVAADATGKWTGTLLVNGEQTRPAHLVLKQDGSKLTGTAGPNADEQHPIENGKIENGILTFDLPGENAVMKFVLKHEADEIKGEVTRERDGETQHAKLAVKRAQ